MSHIATNWAFKNRLSDHTARIVLLELADCHTPDRGCFASKTYLQEVCCMSLDELNDKLEWLFQQGLVKCDCLSGYMRLGRETTYRFRLAFEADFERDRDLPPASSEYPS
jgi:hypothetical protein